jgi:hypothetical protein
MTGGKAAGAPEASLTALEACVAAAQDLLGRVRRALAGGELADLDRLAPLLRALADQLGRLPQTDQHLRTRLLALLEETGNLAEMLRKEQARLAVQLRAVGAYRHAGTAYRRTSRL